VYTSKEEQGNEKAFLKIYEPCAYQGTLEANRSKSRKLKKTTVACRFCKKTQAETKFTQDTHLISNLLGRNTYYSHDECDTCNQFFTRYENDLANYLGTSRVFNHLLHGIKAPGFTSRSDGIKIKNYGNDFIYVENASPERNDFQVDMTAGKVALAMETREFLPENVYRALLKMAMGTLPETEIAAYEVGFKFLLNMEKYPELDCLKKVVIAETDLTIGRPFTLSYQKRADANYPQFPKHIFCLYVGNYMFQLLVPGHPDGPILATNAKMPLAPYYQLNVSNRHDAIVRGRILEDLHSTAPKSNDNSLKMEFSTENLVAIQLDFDLKSFLDNIGKNNDQKVKD